MRRTVAAALWGLLFGLAPAGAAEFALTVLATSVETSHAGNVAPEGYEYRLATATIAGDALAADAALSQSQAEDPDGFPNAITIEPTAFPDRRLVVVLIDKATTALDLVLPDSLGRLALVEGAVLTSDPTPEPTVSEPVPAQDNATGTLSVEFAHPRNFGALLSLAGNGGQVDLVGGGIGFGEVGQINNGLQGTDEALTQIDFTTEAPAQIVFTFEGGQVAEIEGVAINTLVRSSLDWLPGRVELYASMDGASGPWQLIGATEELPVSQTKLFLSIPEPVAAKAIMVQLMARTGGPSGNFSVRLSEIEVYERLSDAGYASLLSDREVDLLLPQNGGRVAYFTSQSYSRGDGLVGLFANNTMRWFPAEERYPQELVFSFREFAVIPVGGIAVAVDLPDGRPESWAPKVRVSVSTGYSPLGGFQEVGYLQPDASENQLSLNLAPAAAARFLKLTIIEPGAPRMGIRGAQITSTFDAWLRVQHETELATDETVADTSTMQSETESNDDPSYATPMDEDLDYAGRSDRSGDVDFFSFAVEGETPQTVNFVLRGKPHIRTTLQLLASGGGLLFDYSPASASVEQFFTWKLDPGNYLIRLEEPQSGVAIVIDDSGSMGSNIFTAMDAAKLFALAKQPDERLSLIRFAGEVEILSELTTAGSVIAEAIDAGVHKDGGSGTSVYDAVLAGIETLQNEAGNRAIVLLTDGEDVSSKTPYPELWREITAAGVPIYAIGLGNAMRQFDSAVGSDLDDMLHGFSLGTLGAYFDSPTGEELHAVYDEIAARIRDRGSYTISFSIADDEGRLQVLETGEEFVSAAAVGNIMLIMDASGSMRAGTDQGRQRINVARTVLLDLLREIPQSVPVGLRVYGQNLSAEPKERSCRDSELSVAPLSNTRDQITDVVKAIAPRGQTPLGYSLALAAEDAGGADNSLIILLTDGEETCDEAPGDPYYPEDVARGLVEEGFGLRINIVGFDVSDSATQDSLAAVAGITGGEFYFGGGELGLRRALRSAFVAPYQVMDDLGQLIAESKVGAAPLTLPTGRYHVSLAGSDVISGRQQVVAKLDTRIYVNKEADETHVRVEQVAPGSPFADDVRRVRSVDDVNADPADLPPATPEYRVSTRLPATEEELAYAIQAMLNEMGYPAGPSDGAWGAKSRSGAQAFLDSFPLILDEAPFYADGKPTVWLWLSILPEYVKPYFASKRE
jgi:Mg-chelatase subunit ChlD